MTERGDAREDLCGRTIAGARLRRLLGRGRAGTVYLAGPARPPGPPVAIKLLHPGLIDVPSFAERFQREARLGGRVEHPGVVRVLDSGSVQIDGARRPFLILEYVAGETLRELLDRLGRLPEALVRYLGAQVAGALTAIHAAGAVHRDLKPENVIVTPERQVKVTDFGIARLLDDGVITSASDFVGTPRYAAPEQFEGLAVGPRADLYSLGVILYEAATGRQPFVGSSYSVLLRSHLEEQPSPPRDLNPSLTPLLEELLLALLAKDPDSRPRSARDIEQTLTLGEASPWWQSRPGRATARGGGLPSLPAAIRDAPFVGRDAEMATLAREYRETAGGRGRLVLIEGEAGIGKTRLVVEFAQALAAGVDPPLLLHGASPLSCEMGEPDAVRQALLAYLSEVRLELRLADFLPNCRRMIPALAAHLRGRRIPGRGLTIETVHGLYSRLAQAIARAHPLVWIVEDLHLAAQGTVSLLLTLGRVARDHRLLLLVTSRPPVPADLLARFGSLECTSRLSLGRLALEDVKKLLEPGAHPLAERLAEDVARRSDGNPYFALEMIRMLKGHAADESGRGLAEAAAIGLPASIRDTLLARLERVAPVARAFLDVGAVQGHRFDPDLVARTLRRDRLLVLQSLAELCTHAGGVLKPDGCQFRFDHHLLREVVYARLAPALKAEYHARLAAAYAEREGIAGTPDDSFPGDAAVFLASHSLRAGKADLARSVLLHALGHLRAHCRHEQTIELADLALELFQDAEPGLRSDVRLLQADCLGILGRPAPRLALIEDAIRAAERAGDRRRLLLARCALAEYWTDTEFERSRGEARELTRRARAIGDRTIERRALRILSMSYRQKGGYRAALAIQRLVLHLAREAGVEYAEASILSDIGISLQGLGRYEEARRYHEEYASISRASGALVGEATALCNLGTIDLCLGRYESAEATLRRQQTVSREAGYRYAEAVGSGMLGAVRAEAGDLAGARQGFNRYLTLARETGDTLTEMFARTNLGHLALMEGRLEEATAHALASETLYRQLEQLQGEASPHVLIGNIALALDDGAEAEHRFRIALALGERLGVPYRIAGAALALGCLQVRFGERDAAAPLLEQADRLAREHGFADPGSLPAAYLALISRRDPASVTFPGPMPAHIRAEVYLALWRAGGAAENEAQATRLLERLSSHLDGAALAAFRQHSPLTWLVRNPVRPGP